MIKNVTTQELEAVIAQNNENTVLIDVRAAEECAEGIIEGADNLDLFQPDFIERIGKLDKSKDYYMICRSGGRSNSAAGAMDEMGFESVTNMLGGMLAWNGKTV